MFLTKGHPAFTFTTVETSDGLTNCETREETTGDTWHACPQSWKVRPLLIYSADRGAITVKDNTPGHHSETLTVPYSPLPLPHGSQLADYCPSGRQTPNGYRFLVRDGADITVTVAGNAADADWKDVFVVDYSQPTWPTAKKSSITMTVTGAGAITDGLSGGPYPFQATTPEHGLSRSVALCLQRSVKHARKQIKDGHMEVAYVLCGCVPVRNGPY